MDDIRLNIKNGKYFPGFSYVSLKLDSDQHRKWMKERDRLLEVFQDDLLQYLGLSNHPLAKDFLQFVQDKSPGFGMMGIVEFAESIAKYMKLPDDVFSFIHKLAWEGVSEETTSDAKKLLDKYN